MNYDIDRVNKLRKQNLTVFEEIYQIRLEIVRGCNLNCDFCARTKTGFSKMSMETFNNILQGLTNRVRRMELAVQGEPTLHPLLSEFISKARIKFPKLQIYIISNMEIYRKKDNFEKVIQLFKKGLDFIQADMYSKEQLDWILHNIKIHKDKLEKEGVNIYNYYKENFNMFSYKKGKYKGIIITDETEGFSPTKNITRKLHNWGGNLPLFKWDRYIANTFLDLPLQVSCVEPLKYCTVGSKGEVYICCRDCAKSIIIGNVNETNIQELWCSKALQIVRFILKNKRRDLLAPCVLCTGKGFRSGLYAYWGKNYSSKVIEDTLRKIHIKPNEEPLYNNLREYSKYKKLSNFLKNLLELS